MLQERLWRQIELQVRRQSFLYRLRLQIKTNGIKNNLIDILKSL